VLAGIKTKVKILVFASVIVAIVVAAIVFGAFTFQTAASPKTTIVRNVVASFSASNALGAVKTSWSSGEERILAWGYGLGSRSIGDNVTVNLSSVYEVYVCLAEVESIMPNMMYMMYVHSIYKVEEMEKFAQERLKLIGTQLPIDSAACKEKELLKAGTVTFTIPSPDHYVLVIGKAAGYLTSSFKIDVTISELKVVN
jgi:hypothetical protein